MALACNRVLLRAEFASFGNSAAFSVLLHHNVETPCLLPSTEASGLTALPWQCLYMHSASAAHATHASCTMPLPSTAAWLYSLLTPAHASTHPRHHRQPCALGLTLVPADRLCSQVSNDQ